MLQALNRSLTETVKKCTRCIASFLPLLAGAALAQEDLSSLCADRAAVERVYYKHRTGEKPPFEKATPPELIQRLVQSDLHKEAVLKKIYGVEISPAQLDAETRRIDSATRAPDVLAELKAALGNDLARFDRAIAKPIVIERALRERFENDDRLHASQRHQIESVRAALLAAKTHGDSVDSRLARLKSSVTNQLVETIWQLGARPDTGPKAIGPNPLEIQERFGPKAQLISSPGQSGIEEKTYFGDLPSRLQAALRAQLQQPGDISAVIEMPARFVVYLAEEKTELSLKVASVSVPKMAYEQWLGEQSAP